MELSETDLRDKDGVEHHYLTMPLDCDVAFDLKLDLLDAAAGPLAGSAGAIADIDLEGPLDVEKVLKALGGLPAEIIRKGGSKLVARILAKTQRVFPGPDGKPRRVSLAKPEARTEAYSGGNMIELYRAMAWVIVVNYGPFLTDVLARYKELSTRFSVKPSATDEAENDDSTMTSDAI